MHLPLTFAEDVEAFLEALDLFNLLLRLAGLSNFCVNIFLCLWGLNAFHHKFLLKTLLEAWFLELLLILLIILLSIFGAPQKLWRLRILSQLRLVCVRVVDKVAQKWVIIVPVLL